MKFSLTYLVNTARAGFDPVDVARNIHITASHVRPDGVKVHLLGGNKKLRANFSRRAQQQCKGVAVKVYSSAANSMYTEHHKARMSTVKGPHLVLEGHEIWRGDADGIVQRFKAGAFNGLAALACPVMALAGKIGTQYRRTDHAWGTAFVCRIWLPDQVDGGEINTAELIGCWHKSWVPVLGAVVTEGWRPELTLALAQQQRRPQGARAADLPIGGTMELSPIPAGFRPVLVIADHELAADDPIRAMASEIVIVDGAEGATFADELVGASVNYMAALRYALVVPAQKAYWTPEHALSVSVAVSRASLTADPYALVWRAANNWPVFWALDSRMIPMGAIRPQLDGAIEWAATEFKCAHTRIEVPAMGVGGTVAGVDSDPSDADHFLDSFLATPINGCDALEAIASARAQEDTEVMDSVLWGALAARSWCPLTTATVLNASDTPGVLSDADRESAAVVTLDAFLSAKGKPDQITIRKIAAVIENPSRDGDATITVSEEGADSAIGDCDQRDGDQGSTEAPL